MIGSDETHPSARPVAALPLEKAERKHTRATNIGSVIGQPSWMRPHLAGGSMIPEFAYPRWVAELHTDRLLLRQWREADFKPFAAMNLDPVVMEHFPALMDEEESERWAHEIRSQIGERGWGLWAVQLSGGPPFAGFVGLNVPRFMPDSVEVGWRLVPKVWGHGYATEAARAAVRFGFEELALQEIVSFTIPANGRSWRVMERLGMTHDPADDFDHPFVDPGPIKHHLLYRLSRERWEQTNGTAP